jgi:hypothetical protein
MKRDFTHIAEGETYVVKGLKTRANRKGVENYRIKLGHPM